MSKSARPNCDAKATNLWGWQEDGTAVTEREGHWLGELEDHKERDCITIFSLRFEG